MGKYTLGAAAKHSGIPKSHIMMAIANGALTVEYRDHPESSYRVETVIDSRELKRFMDVYYDSEPERVGKLLTPSVEVRLSENKKKRNRVRQQLDKIFEEREQRLREDW